MSTMWFEYKIPICKEVEENVFTCHETILKKRAQAAFDGKIETRATTIQIFVTQTIEGA
jgi:hypothetical protein